MLSKSKYVTPVYRGSGYGRTRKRKRKLKFVFIFLAVLILLYLAFMLFSHKDNLIKKEVKPIDAPKSFSAVQMANGKYKFKWSAVKDANGYKLYKYDNQDYKYKELKVFNGNVTSYISKLEKSKYAVKAFKKADKKIIYSKNYTECKMKSITDMIEIVGHRGAMDQAPENTLVSYRRAFVLGYAGFETDYFETDSGDLIICHDKDISIFTGINESILNLTDETRFNYPITKGVNVKEYDTQFMPTFEEAVSAASKYKMNIYLHTKNPDITDGAIEKIEAIINEYDMRDNATVFTPSRDLFIKFKEYNFRAGFLILPNSSADIESAVEFAGKNKADVLIMRYTGYLKQKHIDSAHNYHLKVGCYDRSDLKSAFKMAKMKIDFMITNEDFLS